MNKKALFLSIMLLFGLISPIDAMNKISVKAQCGTFLAENIVKGRFGFTDSEAKDVIRESLGFLKHFVNTNRDLSVIMQVGPLKKVRVKSIIVSGLKKKLCKDGIVSKKNVSGFVKSLCIKKLINDSVDVIVKKYNSLFKKKNISKYELNKTFYQIDKEVEEIFCKVESKVIKKIVELYFVKVMKIIKPVVVAIRVTSQSLYKKLFNS